MQINNAKVISVSNVHEIYLRACFYVHFRSVFLQRETRFDF